MNKYRGVETATIIFTWISFAISTVALAVVCVKHFGPNQTPSATPENQNQAATLQG